MKTYRMVSALLMCGLVTTQTVLPSFVFAAAYRTETRQPRVPVQTALVSKGVPHMIAQAGVSRTPTLAPLPSDPVPLGPGVTLLDEEAYLHRGVSSSQVASWQEELTRHPEPARKARLLVQVGEILLADHEPARAEILFNRAASVLPVENPDRGLARFDAALSLFLQGRYRLAKEAFRSVSVSALRGVNRRLATMYVRHSAACEGYHASHSKLGIPEPPFLDPLCGVSSMAVCLRGLGLPFARSIVAAKVRHDGEGSSMGDLLASLPSFGLTGRFVVANEEGLRKLPKPLVAHVERDHFVAVVRADKNGVSYLCSDCGPWPGGLVDLTWEQWRAMEADRFLVVVKPGSAEAIALDCLPTQKEQGPGHAFIAAVSPSSLRIVATAERMLSELGTSVLGQTFPIQAPFTPICGARGTSPHCPDGGPAICIDGEPICPMDGLDGFDDGTDDPVNLATAEEQYVAQRGLRVYNPTGPSVYWTHASYGLANVIPNGFGSGWTHPYNIRIEDNSAMVAGLSLSAALGPGMSSNVVLPPPPSATPSVLVLPNSGRIQFTADPNNPPSASVPVVHLAVQPGYRILVDWRYNASTGGKYFVVTTQDRSKWTFEPCNGTSSTTGRCYPLSITDKVGNFINLNWSSFTFVTIDPVTGGFQAKGLVSITDSSNASLLVVSYGSNGRVTSVSDRYGRSIYYTVQNFANTGVPAGIPTQTNDELTQVSQVVPTGTGSPLVRFQYGYHNYGNTEAAANETIPYLHTIAVPSATGTGMATATVDYNSIGEVSDTIDANGNVTTYGPAFAGSPFQSPQSNSGRVQVKTSSGSVVHQYDKYFDSHMNETKLVNALGQMVWTKSYGDPNTAYRPSSMVDGNSRTWSFTYDQFGHTKTSTTPKGTVTTYTYSYGSFALGELTSVKQGAKTATTYTYNEPSGLVATVSGPIPGDSGTGLTQTTSFSYDALGNLTQVVSPGNNAVATRTTTFGYTTDGTYSQSDAIGEPITVTDSLGKVSHLRYDARRNMVSETDSLGNQTQHTYNIVDQPSSTVNPATGQTGSGNGSQTTLYLYPGGPVVQANSVNESGTVVRTVNMTYGQEGEILSQTGSSEAVSFTYDAAYHSKTVTDGNGNPTTYTYDLAGRVAKIAYSGATGANYDQIVVGSYDAVDNPLSRTDGDDQVTNYTYGDTDGCLSAVSYVGNSSLNVNIAYDAFDRVTSYNDATGSGTMAFDDLGNVTSTTRTYIGLPTQMINFAYWPDHTRRTMTNVAGTWSYSYDADGRYTSLVSPAGTSSATYLDNSWQATRSLPNGAVTTYVENAAGMLTGVLNKTSGGSTLSQYGSFSYDAAINPTGFSASVPGATSQSGATTIAYDAKNRLTQESSTRAGGYSFAYGYDNSGNPTTFKGASQGFNANNQQTTGGSFVYDGDGNPTTYKSASFSFDPENRVTTIASNWTAGYRIDGLRGWKNAGGVKTYYLYDHGQPVVEMNSSGNVTAVNVFAPDGLVARQQGGTWTQYTFDPQGNVAQRLDASQNVTSSSMYDAYGTESTVGSTSDVFGFNARWGYLLDRETGLYLCQHRYYDPGAGRWVNRDPIGFSGGINLYSYCGQGPERNVDKSGLTSEEDWNKIENCLREAGKEDLIPYAKEVFDNGTLHGYLPPKCDGPDGISNADVDCDDIIGTLEMMQQAGVHASEPAWKQERRPSRSPKRNNPGFWRADNPWAWAAGAGLVIVAGAAIIATGGAVIAAGGGAAAAGAGGLTVVEGGAAAAAGGGLTVVEGGAAAGGGAIVAAA